MVYFGLMLMTVWLIGMLYSVARLIRLRFVDKLIFPMIPKILDLCLTDISNDKPWKWRWEAFDKVTYDTLNPWQPWKWKPLKPEFWWNDISFLEE